MKKISVPEVASIIVTGPVGCGKSAVVDRIKQVLATEFHALVVVLEKGREPEREEVPEWEKKVIASTLWVIKEATESNTHV